MMLCDIPRDDLFPLISLMNEDFRYWQQADSFHRRAECLLSGVKRTLFHIVQHVR
jgi:Txe/YoeB family toxin of Txe-Axe toxin-antitoxin module